MRTKVRRDRTLRPFGVGKGSGLGIGEVCAVGQVSEIDGKSRGVSNLLGLKGAFH